MNNMMDSIAELGRPSEKSDSHISVKQRDDEILAAQGKKPQLKRNFGFWSMLGFTTTMIITWEAIFITNNTALLEAGPVGLFWGYVYTFFGTLCTAASLAELVSLAPTSGGQYHWVAIIAPQPARKFLSWATGWMSVIGWQALTASGAFLCATMIQGVVILNYPTDYIPKMWHGTLIMYAVLLVIVFVNTVAARALPHIETIILIIHVLGFFGLLIPIVTLAPEVNSAKFVFTSLFTYDGYWSNNGVGWLIGLQSSVFAFLGYDGACHMAEEVQNAQRTVPRCMITAVLLNGALGFGMIIAFLFVIGDLSTVLQLPYIFDFIDVFSTITGVRGGTAMSSILIAMAIFATIGLLASTSRMTWAFARDNGLPLSNVFSKVHQRSALPLYSIAVTSLIAAILGVINVGSTTAFNAMTSVTIAGLSFSYFMPILLILLKRFTKEGPRFGPWTMGPIGGFVNAFALVFLIVTTVFSFFPPALPVTATNMNYSIVVFGGWVLIGAVYYTFFGRKTYVGPIIEVEAEFATELY